MLTETQAEIDRKNAEHAVRCAHSRDGHASSDWFVDSVARAYEEQSATIDRLRDELEQIRDVACGEEQVAEDDSEGMGWIWERAKLVLSALPEQVGDIVRDAEIISWTEFNRLKYRNNQRRDEDLPELRDAVDDIYLLLGRMETAAIHAHGAALGDAEGAENDAS